MDEWCLNGVVEGFQKNAGIPAAMSSFFGTPFTVTGKR